MAVMTWKQFRQDVFELAIEKQKHLSWLIDSIDNLDTLTVQLAASIRGEIAEWFSGLSGAFQLQLMEHLPPWHDKVGEAHDAWSALSCDVFWRARGLCSALELAITGLAYEEQILGETGSCMAASFDDWFAEFVDQTDEFMEQYAETERPVSA